MLQGYYSALSYPSQRYSQLLAPFPPTCHALTLSFSPQPSRSIENSSCASLYPVPHCPSHTAGAASCTSPFNLSHDFPSPHSHFPVAAPTQHSHKLITSNPAAKKYVTYCLVTLHHSTFQQQPSTPPPFPRYLILHTPNKTESLYNSLLSTPPYLLPHITTNTPRATTPFVIPQQNLSPKIFQDPSPSFVTSHHPRKQPLRQDTTPLR